MSKNHLYLRVARNAVGFILLIICPLLTILGLLGAFLVQHEEDNVVFFLLSFGFLGTVVGGAIILKGRQNSIDKSDKSLAYGCFTALALLFLFWIIPGSRFGF
ncbi:MAG: hypothetical protein ABJP02_13100 [Parasphingorhabdus sp.]|uniref:hypothetical protein n=1 Tax=Parasphingorhabdus sp. TaxID=2709688 RepID=UPI003297C316